MKIYETFHPLENEDFLYLHFKVYFQPSSKSYYCAVAPTTIVPKARQSKESGEYVFQYIIEDVMNKCYSLTLKTDVSKNGEEARMEAIKEFEENFFKWENWYPNYKLSFKKLLSTDEMQKEVLRKISLS